MGKKLKSIVAATLVSLPLIALPGCAGRPMTTAMAPCAPPVVYLQDVPEPTLTGKTNKDLADYVLGLREALRRSNLDKSRLREWMGERIVYEPTEK
jgi:hypothetical protein